MGEDKDVAELALIENEEEIESFYQQVEEITEADLAKIRKKLPTGMAEELEAMSVEQLNDRIKQSAINIADITFQEKSNPKIKATAEALKEMKAPFRDGRKVQKDISEYSIKLLKLKGKA